MSPSRVAWPRVHGGWLCECVGGPCDGLIVFLPRGGERLHASHLDDPRQGVVLSGTPAGGERQLGWYQRLRGVDDPDEVYWHPLPSAEAGKP